MARRITIKLVAVTTGVSASAVKNNVENLLRALPMDQRIEVMEYMMYCKENRNVKEEIE